MHKNALSLLLAALLLLLAGCGGAGGTSDPAAPAAPGASAPGDGDVSGDEREDSSTDALAGSYYNDYLHLTLTLDGRGGCTLTGPDTDAAGTYAAFPDGLTLDFGTRQETAYAAPNGDLALEGRSGFFLRDWAFWGITEAEAGAQLGAPGRGTETVDLGGGSFRYRDFAAGVAFTGAAGMEVLPDRLSGAVAVTDGADGYVTGRNVTQALAAAGADAAAFLETYIQTYTFAEFDVFFGGLTAYDALEFFESDIPGRLAAASLRIRNEAHTADVNVILYTSAYADGTENYICKSYFAPADDAARLDALAAAVTDMSAVRMQ